MISRENLHVVPFGLHQFGSNLFVREVDDASPYVSVSAHAHIVWGRVERRFSLFLVATKYLWPRIRLRRFGVGVLITRPVACDTRR